MVQEIHRISGVDVSALKRSFRKVHQAHRTSEYAFAIQELDVLETIDAGLSPEERLKKYDSAIHAFRSTRRKTLRLYPGVKETLQRLRDAGVMVVAHSDSMMTYVSRRLRQLDVDGCGWPFAPLVTTGFLRLWTLLQSVAYLRVWSNRVRSIWNFRRAFASRNQRRWPRSSSARRAARGGLVRRG